MRRIPILVLFLAFAVSLASPAAAAHDSSRVIALGGALTEIVYALGAGDRLVGADAGSTFPAAAAKLPRTGHARDIAVEGLLALKPTLVFATEEAGPPESIAKLKAAGVPLVIVPAAHSLADATARVRTMGEALGTPARGDSLAKAIEAKIATVRPSKGAAKPRVLFIYARGAGTATVAGTETAADAMIDLAGGANATPSFTGYRPLTAEGALAAKPDVILVPSASVESLGGVDALLALPGLAQTPAGKAKKVIAMDALYLLGFGPRSGDAVAELSKAIAAKPGK